MLIIEIILTIFVWRKGWKWLSLLPVGVASLIAFSFGFLIAASGGDVANIESGLIFFDIIAIVALIIMLTNSPKTNNQLNNKENGVKEE